MPSPWDILASAPAARALRRPVAPAAAGLTAYTDQLPQKLGHKRIAWEVWGNNTVVATTLRAP